MSHAFRQICMTLMLALTFCACAKPLTAEEDFVVEELLSGQGVIWGMAFPERTQILFTQRSGEIKQLDLATGSVTVVTGAPKVAALGQGGLLDVALSPNYEEDRRLYFTYSKPIGNGYATTLSRARLQGTRLVEWTDLFISNVRSDKTAHFGSRITFDGKGHLFFSHGDRLDRKGAQDLATHGGTLIRLNLDGSVPEDNPFVTEPGAMPEIWSYGHRNPQGIHYDKISDRLWEVEHGPRGGDEINLIKPGNNYGWAVISYGKEYTLPVMVGEGTHKEGMEQPEKVYIPSIAPSSLLLYTGSAFPSWEGDLFIGALAMTHLNHVIVEEGKIVAEKRYLENLRERIRQVIQGPEGYLYLSTDSGKILRLKPAKKIE